MMDRRRESSIRRREAAAGPADETAEQQLERMHQELEQEVVDRPASGGLAAAEFLSVGAGSVIEEERENLLEPQTQLLMTFEVQVRRLVSEG